MMRSTLPFRKKKRGQLLLRDFRDELDLMWGYLISGLHLGPVRFTGKAKETSKGSFPAGFLTVAAFGTRESIAAFQSFGKFRMPVLLQETKHPLLVHFFALARGRAPQPHTLEPTSSSERDGSVHAGPINLNLTSMLAFFYIEKSSGGTDLCRFPVLHFPLFRTPMPSFLHGLCIPLFDTLFPFLFPHFLPILWFSSLRSEQDLNRLYGLDIYWIIGLFFKKGG